MWIIDKKIPLKQTSSKSVYFGCANIDQEMLSARFSVFS